MIVRTLSEAKQSNRRMVSPDDKWESSRLLLKKDQMGFSFHSTNIYKGAEFQMHYQSHLESVYCISGKSEAETLTDGKKHPIEPGTAYILDKHNKHVLRAIEEMTTAYAFNPPLNGKEVHNAEGAYELEAENIENQGVAV